MASARVCASRTISVTRVSACARSRWPCSAAASPSAILRLRACSGPSTIGHTNLSVTHTSAPKISICAMIVAFRFTALTSPKPAVLLDERVCKGEEQRDTDADHRHGVEQAGDDEHLDLQHWYQLRLSRGTFKEFAAQKAKADGSPERTETDQYGNRYRSHAVYVRNLS